MNQSTEIVAVPELQLAALKAMQCGDYGAFTLVIRQNNQRMYRIARSILRDDGEAEDIVQEAYIKAFTGIDTLRSPSGFSAWLARITANLAISRYRQIKRQHNLVQEMPGDIENMPEATEAWSGGLAMTPERHAAIGEIRLVIEAEIDALPDGFREVFMLRMIEGMTIEETADALGILPQTVKTRLHRARGLLRKALESRVNQATLNAFPFLGKRCDRIVQKVLTRLGDLGIVNSVQRSH
ncbi:MAG: RNA polymerase sigma factor [Rhizobiales bacterium]|nr:RNA polymerase sigma factor [Hyphomicrobiales bacterium]